MKRYFITGLVILLPLAVTFAVIIFFFNLLTEPLAGFVSSIFSRNGFLEDNPLGSQLQYFFSQLLILIFLFFFTIAVGMITRYFFVKSLLHFWEYAIHKIPFISAIYKTSKDVIKTIFSSKESAFKQVVLAPFPYEDSYALGFLTQKNIKAFSDDDKEKASVFIPTTPNPTSGFLMLFEDKDLIYLDMSIEEAFKYVISCGVINMPLKKLEKKDEN